MAATVKKRSVVVHGHRTSVSLEAAFWDALRDLAAARRLTINQLVGEIDTGRSAGHGLGASATMGAGHGPSGGRRPGGGPGPAGNLSSAIRVYVLNAVRARAAPPPAVESPSAAGATPSESRAATARPD